jgi:anaerobic selenocysteine-containing dehydrogenase
LKLQVENNRIVRVRGDKENPRSEGYVCRKGANIAYYQHHRQRLTHPLKQVNGEFIRISWDQAIGEIAESLKTILAQYGPRSLAFMGGGGQGSHTEGAFGSTFFRNLGSHYHYSAVAQELTGFFWVNGRSLGKQTLIPGPDEERAEMLVAIGWNGMESHQMPQAPKRLKRFAKDPNKLLVVIDPRLSETARIASIHLPLRPGTDALLARAMIALILKENWQKQDYIDMYVTGFESIKPWFEGFDIKGALAVCELEYHQVYNLCHLMTTKQWCMHTDLGIYMSRHSTLNSYLWMVLATICGRMCVPGGNAIMGAVVPIVGHSDERDLRNWRTMVTDFPAICKFHPPNVMPEEILSDHPQRLRGVIVSGANPLRSYADTTAYEKAFKRLDQLVTIEVAMTETARLSHYVLPAKSGYESWDTTFFNWSFPEVYFQMRQPAIEPVGEQLEAGEIFTRLAEALGLIPELPASLYQAAEKGRQVYGMELMTFLGSNPKAAKVMPFVLAKTLGKTMRSANLAALWGILMTGPKVLQENAARAGFTPGPLLGEDLFQYALDHPQGFWIGKCDPENNMTLLRTDDGKIHVHFPEMETCTKNLTAQSEEEALMLPKAYPLILCAGQHNKTVANTIMRDPAWNEGKRVCTLSMNPKDAESLGVQDGQQVRVITEAGQVEIELEITADSRVGQVVIPHGFGLQYEGKTTGVNVNLLTKNTHRDPFTATPLHRYVPCRVEAI